MFEVYLDMDKFPMRDMLTMLQHGAPVLYMNSAIPKYTGKGVIVEPPPDDADDNLRWWYGSLKGEPDGTQLGYNRLVGPELGLISGHRLRVTVPWCLALDLTNPAGRDIAIRWLCSNPELRDSPVKLRDECLKLGAERKAADMRQRVA